MAASAAVGQVTFELLQSKLFEGPLNKKMLSCNPLNGARTFDLTRISLLQVVVKCFFSKTFFVVLISGLCR